MKKVLIIILTLIIIIAGGYLLITGNQNNESDSNNQLKNPVKENKSNLDIISEEVPDDFTDFIIETEVDGPEDCTKLEKYNPKNNTCYIECETEEDCDEKEAQLDEALAALEDDYQDFSKKFNENHSQLTDNSLSLDYSSANQAGEKTDEEKKAIAIYKIQQDENYVLVSGKEDPKNKKVKKWLKAIAPEDFSNQFLERLILYSSPESDTGAFVLPNPTNPKK